MTRTWDQSKELWCRIYEVEDLRNEKEKECFAKMTEDPYNSKNHASKVTVSISDKDFSWVPIVLPQSNGDA